MIYIVNKYKHNPTSTDYYCGRGSLFGNPYTHIKDKQTLAQFIVDTREEAIDKYEEYFNEVILNNEPSIIKLNSMKEVSKHNDIYLICFCVPKKCHCEVIKRYLEQ